MDTSLHPSRLNSSDVETPFPSLPFPYLPFPYLPFPFPSFHLSLNLPSSPSLSFIIFFTYTFLSLYIFHLLFFVVNFLHISPSFSLPPSSPSSIPVSLPRIIHPSSYTYPLFSPLLSPSLPFFLPLSSPFPIDRM